MIARLEILACEGPAWVQDGGRPGHLAEGVPPGGALVPERLAEGNAAVGNAWDAAAIEAFGAITVAARGGDLALAWRGEAVALRRDHVRRFAAEGLAYLAVGGGLDVPVVLGGRGLLAVAGIGGGVGRPLRAGDVLAVGFSARGEAGGTVDGTRRAPQAWAPDPRAVLRVVRGPDPERFAAGAFEAFVATEWRVGRADRVGMRLEGPAIPRPDDDRAASTPMIRGAVQVPAGGGPIVLGPDHPTTGGYPVVAVVIRADQGALAERAPGAGVRFREVGVEEARPV